MKIAVILGTRPEIIKMQPIIREIQKRGHELTFIHTGQHFDFEMSDIFVDELELPKPNYFLNIKSSSQGVQTGKIIAKCDQLLIAERPDITLVEGDTNSALGGSIAASKLDTPIGHVEAGCRSFNKSMSEEVNRILISDVTNLHFCPTKNCRNNLLREGISASQIFVTGHPIVDLINEVRHKIPQSSDIVKGQYSLVTLHRRENITNKGRITNILRALADLSKKTPLIFPCHPHTKLFIIKYGLNKYLANIILIRPVGYLQSLNLVKHANFVLTDSGGIQQEAALLCTPCVTLRQETEWVETVESGINFLAGQTTQNIIKTVEFVEANYDDILINMNSNRNMFGNIGVSRRIITLIGRNYA